MIRPIYVFDIVFDIVSEIANITPAVKRRIEILVLNGFVHEMNLFAP